LLDNFYSVDIPLDRLAELYDEDPLRIFELVKPFVERLVSRIDDVKLYRSFLSRRSGSASIEYMVKTSLGGYALK